MKKTLFILFLLLVTSVSAQEIFNAESLLLDISMNNGYILNYESSNSEVEYVRAEFQFYPLDSYQQDILSTETDPEADIQESIILFEWDRPSFEEYDFSVNSRVRTHNKLRPIYSKVKFPIDDVPAEYQIYLEESEKIDITDDIIQKANEIAEGEDDLYKVVFKLASWTKTNINYNLTTVTADASQKASWVLDNRYGVCDELTNLFIAMNRALGIPARFVSGLSYTNSELFEDNWGLHGWAEVYFPEHGWVSFDPTYGQYGYIDPTHVKLSQSVDSDKSSTRFEWEAVNVNLAPKSLTYDVEVVEQSAPMQSPFEVNLVTHANKVGFGSYNFIEVTIKNKQNYYAATELRLNRPREIRVLDEEIKTVLLEPNGEKKLFWILGVNYDLNDRYVYSFPISVSSPTEVLGQTVFTAENDAITYGYAQIEDLIEQREETDEKEYSKNIDIDCSYIETIYVNETFQIECKISNKGNIFLKNLRVCIEQCQNIDLGITQTKSVYFDHTFMERGEHEISVRARNYDVSEFKYLRMFAEEKPKLTIEKIKYPDQLVYGPKFNIKFDIWKHSHAKPKNITVKFVFNNQETIWELDELASNQGFRVDLERTSLNPKDNKFQIILNYHDSRGRIYTKHYEKNLPLEETSALNKVIMWINKINRDLNKMFQGNI